MHPKLSRTLYLLFFFFFFGIFASDSTSQGCDGDAGDRGVNSHADVPVGVVEFHLGARLDPAHNPCLIARDGGHHNPRRGFEVGRLVSEHYGRVLLDDSRAVVYGGRQVVHHDVLPLDARLVTGYALDAAHGCAGEGDGQEQPREPDRPGEQRCWPGLDQYQHYEAVHQMKL